MIFNRPKIRSILLKAALHKGKKIFETGLQEIKRHWYFLMKQRKCIGYYFEYVKE